MAARDSYHVLVVDADPADALRSAEALRQGSIGRFRVSRVATFAAAAESLCETCYDAVVLDLDLPDRQGVEAVEGMLAIAPGMPLVVLSRLDDERLALTPSFKAPRTV